MTDLDPSFWAVRCCWWQYLLPDTLMGWRLICCPSHSHRREEEEVKLHPDFLLSRQSPVTSLTSALCSSSCRICAEHHDVVSLQAEVIRTHPPWILNTSTSRNSPPLSLMLPEEGSVNGFSKLFHILYILGVFCVFRHGALRPSVDVKLNVTKSVL